MNVMRRRMIVSITLILSMSNALGALAQSADLEQHLREYLQAHYANRDFMGEVMIADDNQILAHVTLGMADIESQRLHQSGDIYHVASLTKQFTGAAIALLVSRGQLSLDDTLGKLLPDFSAKILGSSDVSVRMLAQHEAGIPDYNGFPEYALNSQTAMTLDDILDWITNNVSKIEPAGYNYSNSHFALLARIIEIASGQGYREFTRTELFLPAGMTNTDHYRAEEVITGRSAGYDPGHGNDLVNAPVLDNSMKFGSGSLHTTVPDLLAWHRALRNNMVLDSDAQAIYLRASENGYALGVGIATDAATGQRVASHDGKSPGASAYIKRWLDDGRVMIVLSNVNSGVLNQMKDDLTRLMDDEEVESPQPRRIRTVTEEALRVLVGHYRFPPQTDIRIVQQNGGLSLYWGNSGLVQHLAPLADSDWFYMGTRGDRIRFRYSGDGEVSGLEYDWGGGVEFCERLMDKTAESQP